MAPDHYEMMTKRKLPIFSMPPESLQTREWSKASDVWSFGILPDHGDVHKGRNPYEQYFNAHKMGEVKVVIKYLNEGKRVDPPAVMPPELNEVVKKCMLKHGRSTMDAIVVMLTKFCSDKTK